MPKVTDRLLRLRIDFDGYLTARTLGELLICVDEIYDDVLYAQAPHYRALPGADAARLRVRGAAPGSLIVDLVSGATQVIQATDPALKATIAGVPALAALAKMVRTAVDWGLEVRGRVREQNHQTEIQRLELTERRLELLGQTNQMLTELASTPGDSPDESPSASRSVALTRASEALTTDVAKLAQVIARGTVTGVTTELVDEDRRALP
jgi:hypothetical protein